MSGSAGALQFYHEPWTGEPVSLFIAPHALLNEIATEKQVGLMTSREVLLVEWDEEGDWRYRNFIKRLETSASENELNLTVCKIAAENPDVPGKLKHLIATRDDSPFHPYDQTLADKMVDAVVSNWNKSVGIITGQGVWPCVRKELDRYGIPYTPVIMKRY